MQLIRETLKTVKPRSLSQLNHHLQGLLAKHLWAQVLLGFALGIFTGIGLAEGYVTSNPKMVEMLSEWVAFPGYLFLRMIQMIVIPLIFTSVIRGVASSDSLEELKKLGVRIALYFVSTTVVSLFLGVLVSKLMQPGRFMDMTKLKEAKAPEIDSAVAEGLSSDLSFPERLVGLLPQNPFAALTEGEMLQVVIFSLIFGVALISISAKQAQPLLDLMASVQEVCMTVVKWSMYLAPFAVFGLTTKMVSSVGIDALFGLGAYVLTVVVGLLSVIVFYCLMVAFIGGRNPFGFLRSIFSVQLLAFSTSSSAAVMPLSMKTAEDDLKIRPSVAQFVIPLGSTINMDGTAIYQMIATIFLAQAYGIDLSTGQIVLVGLTAVGASIGSPGTPGVGIVILATILQGVGIPLAGTGLIIAVDRILDMLRTVVNVTGDLTASVVMEKLVPETN